MSVIFLTCMMLGSAGALVIRKNAVRLSLVDHPVGRSSHSIPTPKGGGVGILAAFTVASIYLKIQPSFWIPVAVISVISFVGDMKKLAPLFRLAFQFSTALFILYNSELFFYERHLSHISILIFGYVFLAVFIVGSANFYNFMDGINGIASITGIIAFSFLAVYFYSEGMPGPYIIFCGSMAFACVGFLPFNIPDAKVFMGDVGSILLGFTFSTVVVLFSGDIYELICLSAFILPFYADELISMALRIKRGESLLKPHRTHIYQLLANEHELPHWKVAFGYGIVQVLSCICVLMLKDDYPLMLLGCLLVLFLLFCGLSLRLNVMKQDLSA